MQYASITKFTKVIIWCYCPSIINKLQHGKRLYLKYGWLHDL